MRAGRAVVEPRRGGLLSARWPRSALRHGCGWGCCSLARLCAALSIAKMRSERSCAVSSNYRTERWGRHIIVNREDLPPAFVCVICKRDTSSIHHFRRPDPSQFEYPPICSLCEKIDRGARRSPGAWVRFVPDLQRGSHLDRRNIRRIGALAGAIDEVVKNHILGGNND